MVQAFKMELGGLCRHSCITENLSFLLYQTQGHHQPFSKQYLLAAASGNHMASRSSLVIATILDPKESLLNKHPYFLPAPILTLDKQLM